MPQCKNDITRHYIGNEPSPKGLGYCAHAEKIGSVRKGKDGNEWINKSGRWIIVKKLSINKLHKMLFKNILKWWVKLSVGFYIIDIDNNVKYLKNDKNTSNKLKEYEQDKNIKYILWSTLSNDSVAFLVYYILTKCDNDVIENILENKNSFEYFIENFKMFFVKKEIQTKKDYTLKYLDHINEKRIIDKLQKSVILKKLL